jgi:hypothetical protein
MFVTSRDTASAAAVLPTRRFACDRCRGQKLRCLRADPEQERCDRCTKADAICLTTPTLSNHNHLIDGHNAASRKRARTSPARQIPVSIANGSSIEVLQQSYSSQARGHSNQAEDSPSFNNAFLEGLEEIMYSTDAVPMLASTLDLGVNQSYPSFIHDNGPYSCPGGSSTQPTPDSSETSNKTPSNRNDEAVGWNWATCSTSAKRRRKRQSPTTFSPSSRS